MQPGWNEKDKRQFRHILESSLEQGRRAEEARQLAARTVNKQRRLEGRTPNNTSSGTGNPHRPLQDRTFRELYNRARKLDIPGRSKLRKSELVEEIRAAS